MKPDLQKVQKAISQFTYLQRYTPLACYVLLLEMEIFCFISQSRHQNPFSLMQRMSTI